MTTATRSGVTAVPPDVAVLIELLVTKNCPREDAALRLVGMAVRMTGVAPHVMLVEVADLAEARRKAFIGSPTIRVNGRDVAPPSSDIATLSCREYPTDHGRSDIPSLHQLLDAITTA